MLTQTLSVPLDQEVLHHPTTLKVFLAVRGTHPKKIGAREIHRKTGIKSTSTVVWHLEKLEAAKYLVKSPDNRYILSEAGKSLSGITIPISTTFWVFKNELIPRRLVVPVMLLFLAVSSLIFVDSNLLFSYITLLLGSFVASFLLLLDYHKIKKQIEQIIGKE